MLNKNKFIACAAAFETARSAVSASGNVSEPSARCASSEAAASVRS